MNPSNLASALSTRGYEQVPTHLRSPRRITITVNWGTYIALTQRSDEQGRSVSNLAAHLLEVSLRHLVP